jgi:hypothetical protein
MAFLRYFWWKNSISDIATGGVGFPTAGKIETMSISTRVMLLVHVGA